MSKEEEAIFRSAEMAYVQLYVPLEISREVVCLLGNLGLLMFRDLNSDTNEFQRTYVEQLRRCDDTQRLLTFLAETMDKHANVYWHTYTDSGQETLLQNMAVEDLNSINDLTTEIELVESRVRRLDESLNDIQLKLDSLLETRYVVFKAERFLQINPGIVGRVSREYREQQQQNNIDEESFLDNDNFSFTIDSEDEQEQGVHNNHDVDNGHVLLGSGIQEQFMVVGAVRRDKVDTLNKLLWRLLRGNLYFQNIAIEEPLLDSDGLTRVEKDCVVVFTHGHILINKVRRVMESLGAHIIPLDKEHFPKLNTLNDEIDDLQQIAQSTEQALHTELLVVHDQILHWNVAFKREKSIYATLNLFRQETHGLVAEAWLPNNEITDLTQSLKDFVESIGSEYSAVVTIIHTNRQPPTYHRTNKFTDAFQSIVDAYGIATYQEINPGLATIVTFPFMFAIMFGDLGHGFILFLIALVLILNERKFGAMTRDEIFDMAFTGRYVLVLMGAFSMYTGLMYNDMFSKPLTLFKSGWEWPTSFKQGDNISAKQVGVYPFGLDSGWHGTENGLLFSNSYKMKLSILMGFIHMTYSFMFSYINFKRRNSTVDIIGNFIPGLIFMQSIFGYLSWAIVFKWSKDWIKDNKPAPGLLNMLINMFLAPGKIDEQLYKGQAFLQQVLLLAALVCVPWLLLYKPLTLRRLNKSAKMRGYEGIQDQETSRELMETEQQLHNPDNNDMVVTDFDLERDNGGDDSNQHGPNAEFNFGDIMIHQVIHTIEFCLNCISHTASYLRLWALSLAHAQLSSVLWDMTIQNSFSSENSGSPLAVFKVFFLFAMWFVLTVCVLVLMEGTSAMLHALRLHWVEAMSKFFEGEGYAYVPFSFSNMIES
ncbi:similar to Saccharomyces cerevisiae YMR054W STV1 Subunit a of the vacuolar-ATPase V0 domain, one of two isoforms (Stv1p and Vph1p) [Maudiozyma barnettii]|uniref:V-type proton ATPase subunit a n=1 Tax=Maudiozyma barnettii TaxID=61262 RepID=A0A8H2VJS3_9SACH|nr:H(+)-transporting V0 sector ATPase subunit a [Kazachstania barnettii]CAB4256850.1 similar to Saccharomyces cerevisiae YMR054W STV1 Subunit a of the vacuolar-ATPase V0 domain, one of two isoforms (Stv1p and Vph1p) [Kazachstania barnettii]CAD1785269.1 similar to Saccharomyces cerevisiae YMR054W STV1 Subunit a of the vacuolar-ATPase V0 domain, one of two isoforms (Stv1p and Vph1p) [Kazachstania barnettii]